MHHIRVSYLGTDIGEVVRIMELRIVCHSLMVHFKTGTGTGEVPVSDHVNGTGTGMPVRRFQQIQQNSY